MIGPFIGQKHEFAQVVAGLSQIAAGRGQVFLTVGEPGIGKSRFADEIAREARARGLRVAWARCWEGEGAPAYWPWIQALESLGEELPPAPPQDAGAARFALFAAVTARLSAAAQQTPLLLVLDDLHVGDLSSLRLLQFVARAVRSLPIGLVGAYRDVDSRLTPEASRLLAAIAREATYLPLRRFRDDEISAFANELGVPLRGAQLCELARVTDGTPRSPPSSSKPSRTF